MPQSKNFVKLFALHLTDMDLNLDNTAYLLAVISCANVNRLWGFR